MNGEEEDRVIWKDDNKGNFSFLFLFLITMDVCASLRALRLNPWGTKGSFLLEHFILF